MIVVMVSQTRRAVNQVEQVHTPCTLTDVGDCAADRASELRPKDKGDEVKDKVQASLSKVYIAMGGRKEAVVCERHHELFKCPRTRREMSDACEAANPVF